MRRRRRRRQALPAPLTQNNTTTAKHAEGMRAKKKDTFAPITSTPKHGKKAMARSGLDHDQFEDQGLGVPAALSLAPAVAGWAASTKKKREGPRLEPKADTAELGGSIGFKILLSLAQSLDSRWAEFEPRGPSGSAGAGRFAPPARPICRCRRASEAGTAIGKKASLTICPT